MAEDIVDVLIVGAGASVDVVAWSLAETRMCIVCLEQGGCAIGFADRQSHLRTSKASDLHNCT